MRILKKTTISAVPCKIEKCKGKITILQGDNLEGECPVCFTYNYITPTELKANAQEQLSLECCCNTCGGRQVLITSDVELVK